MSGISSTAAQARRDPIWRLALLVVLLLLALPFVWHALRFGALGLTADLSERTHLFDAARPAANAAIFAHMLAGALITALAPLQLIGPLRRRWPAVHRAAGHAIVAGSLIAGAGGLVYIALRETVGGPLMDWGFGLYGVLLILCAVQTQRHGRAGRMAEHRDWALRLFVLAVGSFLYRVHYGLWYLATDGLWTAEGFSGAFDRVQIFAFYLPYLALVELWLRHRRRISAR